MNRRDFLHVAGLTPALFAGSPPARRRLLITEGNSLTSMGNGGYSWPQRIVVEPWIRRLGLGVVNIAIGGATIDDIVQRAPLVDSLAGLADESYLLLFELTNTMRANHGDVQATYDKHRAYCLGRRALGYKVFIGTGISRNQEIYYQQPTNFTHAQMCDLNNQIRQSYHDFADGLIDFAAISELGDENACLNLRYFWDGVHLTGEGLNLVMGATLKMMQGWVNTYYMPIVAS